MASELAATYAPEPSDSLGTVAGAPPGDLALIASAFASASARGAAGGFGLMLDAGFLAAYPDLPIDAAADATAQPLDQVGDTCSDEAFDLVPESTTAQPDPRRSPSGFGRARGELASAVAPSAALIFHGDADTTVPPTLSKSIRDDYCALGANGAAHGVPGVRPHHGDLLGDREIQGWIIDRLDGV